MGNVGDVEASLGPPHSRPEPFLSPHPAMVAQPSHTAGPPSPTWGHQSEQEPLWPQASVSIGHL